MSPVVWNRSTLIYTLTSSDTQPLSTFLSSKGLPYFPHESDLASKFFMCLFKLPTDLTLAQRKDIMIDTRDEMILLRRKSDISRECVISIGWSDIRSFFVSNGIYLSASESNVDLYSLVRQFPQVWEDRVKSQEPVMFLEAKNDVLIREGAEVLIVLPSTAPSFLNNVRSNVDYESIANHLNLAHLDPGRGYMSPAGEEMADFMRIRKKIVTQIESQGGKKLEDLKVSRRASLRASMSRRDGVDCTCGAIYSRVISIRLTRSHESEHEQARRRRLHMRCHLFPCNFDSIDSLA